MLIEKRLARIGLVPTCALILLAGCWPEDLLPSAADNTGSGHTIAPQSITEFYTEIEDNNDFDKANPVFWQTGVELSGYVQASEVVPDHDLFELGAAGAGERVLAELDFDSGDALVMGLYDADGNLLCYINPSNSITGPATIDFTLRRSTDRLYVGVAGRDASNRDRPYSVTVGIQGDGVLGYQPQIVILNFEGADDVKIGNREPVDVPAFDAAVIDASYSGKTETMINKITELIEADYDGLEVEFYRSDDPNIPPGQYTTLYFGTSDDRYLGLAENIDPFNADSEQSAIIFTNEFDLFMIFQPDVDRMAQVLANVTSHELGHLLGLRHTADSEGIMDITASASQMLRDQWFKTSYLHPTVMPMGWQNAPDLLAWALGGSLRAPSKAAILSRQADIVIPEGVEDFYIPHDRLSCSSAE